MRMALVLVIAAGCGGGGNAKNDAATDGKTADTSSDTTNIPCGGAGAACCASNVCNTGLACTTTDHICRTGELWFGAGTDVSAMGYVGHLHGDTGTITLDPIGTGVPFGIWGTAADDVWVIVGGPVGGSGQTSFARHWNGSAWGTQLDFPAGTYYGALWGDSPTNYWTFDNAGSAYRWTGGSAWTAGARADGTNSITEVWGSSATDVWALGADRVAHWGGSSWTATSQAQWATESFYPQISGVRATGEFTAGGYPSRAAVLHHVGNTSTVETLGAGTDCSSVKAVWQGPDEAFAVTYAGFVGTGCDMTPKLWHRTSSGWALVPGGLLDGLVAVNSLWGTSNKDLYLLAKEPAGAAKLYHYDGTTVTPVYTPANVTSVSQIWGTGAPN